jgi:CRP-like cAMP-binding protein
MLSTVAMPSRLGIDKKRERLLKGGLGDFLRRYCSKPQRLLDVLCRSDTFQQVTFHQKEIICRKGDIALKIWIIENGRLGIYDRRKFIAERQRGDLIGEQAFLPLLDHHHRPTNEPFRRHAEMRAIEQSDVWSLDWSVFLAGLSDKDRALFMETIARVLSEKLNQSIPTRAKQIDKIEQLNDLLARFVCPEGLAAVRAQLHWRKSNDLSSFYQTR